MVTKPNSYRVEFSNALLIRPKFNFSNGVGYKQTQCNIVKSTPCKLSIHFLMSCKCKLDVENTKCLKLNLSNFMSAIKCPHRISTQALSNHTPNYYSSRSD